MGKKRCLYFSKKVKMLEVWKLSKLLIVLYTITIVINMFYFCYRSMATTALILRLIDSSMYC